MVNALQFGEHLAPIKTSHSGSAVSCQRLNRIVTTGSIDSSEVFINRALVSVLAYHPGALIARSAISMPILAAW